MKVTKLRFEIQNIDDVENIVPGITEYAEKYDSEHLIDRYIRYHALLEVLHNKLRTFERDLYKEIKDIIRDRYVEELDKGKSTSLTSSMQYSTDVNLNSSITKYRYVYYNNVLYKLPIAYMITLTKNPIEFNDAYPNSEDLSEEEDTELFITIFESQEVYYEETKEFLIKTAAELGITLVYEKEVSADDAYNPEEAPLR